MMKRAWWVIVLAGLAAPVWADDLSNISALNQSQFRALSQDLAGALSYKALAPARSHGVTGFDVGVSLGVSQMEQEDVWAAAVSGGDAMGMLYMPRLYLTKGLPFNLDVALNYFTAPNTNLESWGGEIMWEAVEDGLLMPGVALRGTYTTLQGVDQLAFDTRGVELVVSKGILFVTPYLTLGRHWISSDPQGAAAATLSGESFDEDKLAIGAQMTFGLMRVGVERESLGDVVSYSAKLGFRF